MCGRVLLCPACNELHIAGRAAPLTPWAVAAACHLPTVQHMSCKALKRQQLFAEICLGSTGANLQSLETQEA